MTEDRIFTIENTKSGDWRTFRLREMPSDSKFAPGSTVIDLLIGPANHSDYQAFGFVSQDPVEPSRIKISVWKSRRAELPGEQSEFEKMAILVSKLLTLEARGEALPASINLLDASHCGACGELMTVPKSIRRGIGPVCAKRRAAA